MNKKRYFLHKRLGRDVINDTLCHNWLKGEELEEHMNVQYTKYSALKKENEQLKEKFTSEKKQKENWAFIADCSVQVMNDEEEIKEEYLTVATNELKKMIEENEQLKQFKEKVFNIINKKLKDNEKLDGVDTAMYYANRQTLNELKKGLE